MLPDGLVYIDSWLENDGDRCFQLMETEVLERLTSRLERLDNDPKLNAIIHYLEEERWLENGVIIFSQYYDTAKWIADSLAARYAANSTSIWRRVSKLQRPVGGINFVRRAGF